MVRWCDPRPREAFSLRKLRGREAWEIMREGQRMGYTLISRDTEWAVREDGSTLITYVSAPDKTAAMIKAMDHLGFIKRVPV